MCDIRISDGWWRTYPCQRNGKHAIEVTEDKYGQEPSETLIVRVCGQHKNMLGEGRSLSIRLKGAKADTYVRGVKDERGEAKNRIEHAQWEYNSAKANVVHKVHSVGYAATDVAGELLDLLEDAEHDKNSPYHTLVKTLKNYIDAVTLRGDAYHEVYLAEQAYNELTKKG